MGYLPDPEEQWAQAQLAAAIEANPDLPPELIAEAGEAWGDYAAGAQAIRDYDAMQETQVGDAAEAAYQEITAPEEQWRLDARHVAAPRPTDDLHRAIDQVFGRG